MKLFLVLVAFAISCQVYCEKYTEKYDNMDLNEILGNRRLLVPYVKCMLDQGKCTPEGKDLKRYVADALQTGCQKCTDAQKSGTKKVITHLVKNEPEYWKQLVNKYDPKKTYSKKYEKEMNNLIG